MAKIRFRFDIELEKARTKDTGRRSFGIVADESAYFLPCSSVLRHL